MELEQRISEATAFDRGDKFCAPSEVREYFTPEAQYEMFGGQAEQDAGLLAGWAESVIRNGWHCAFTRGHCTCCSADNAAMDSEHTTTCDDCVARNTRKVEQEPITDKVESRANVAAVASGLSNIVPTEARERHTAVAHRMLADAMAMPARHCVECGDPTVGRVICPACQEHLDDERFDTSAE